MAKPTTLPAFSKVTLPVSCWPRIPRVTFVPFTFTPGLSVSVSPPRLTLWSVAVVLIWTSNVPLTSTLGTFTVTTAVSRPKTPPPVPPEICRNP